MYKTFMGIAGAGVGFVAFVAVQAGAASLLQAGVVVTAFGYIVAKGVR